MKGVFVAAVACLSLSRPDKTPGSSALAADVEYLEPNVQRLVNFLPVSVCKELIDLGEKCVSPHLIFHEYCVSLHAMFCS